MKMSKELPDRPGYYILELKDPITEGPLLVLSLVSEDEYGCLRVGSAEPLATFLGGFLSMFKDYRWSKRIPHNQELENKIDNLELKIKEIRTEQSKLHKELMMDVIKNYERLH